jgi:hypothetical protein
MGWQDDAVVSTSKKPWEQDAVLSTAQAAAPIEASLLDKIAGSEMGRMAIGASKAVTGPAQLLAHLAPSAGPFAGPVAGALSEMRLHPKIG